MRRRTKFMPNENKLNLIPIMDAVFIFIFFLLLSAQFIKMFEIETDAPLVSKVPVENKQNREPLNLRIKVLENSVEVYTGTDGTLYKKFKNITVDDRKIIKSELLELRRKHPEDDYVIIAPLASIEYSKVVILIDTIQILPEGLDSLEIEVKGKKVEKRKIFTQVVLEPLDET